ncbi:hypothetical protein WOC09_20410 [Vibrio parahaemolyticus]
MKTELLNIIEENCAETKQGKSTVYIEILEDSIDQFESEYGELEQSAYLMNYVKKCFRSSIAEKQGRDCAGYKQLMKFVKRWIRVVKMK